MERQQTPAQAIKKELKQKFPGVKFSCRYETFSMGDAVDVERTDGPAREEVEAVTSKYQEGHFDGMNDIYEYSNTNDDIPQAKYVHVKREFSEQIKQLITEFVKEHISHKDEWELQEKIRTELFVLLKREGVEKKVTGVDFKPEEERKDPFDRYKFIY